MTKPKLRLIHGGLRDDRRDNTPERIYVEQWGLFNQDPISPSAAPALVHILNTEPNGKSYPFFPAMSPVTQRDADVAATVIQWLGTNVGLCFVRECETKIKEAREVEQIEFDLKWNSPERTA